jgi:hypothetical protein
MPDVATSPRLLGVSSVGPLRQRGARCRESPAWRHRELLPNARITPGDLPLPRLTDFVRSCARFREDIICNREHIVSSSGCIEILDGPYITHAYARLFHLYELPTGISVR